MKWPTGTMPDDLGAMVIPTTDGDAEAVRGNGLESYSMDG